jgi:hypothetical protein
MVVRFFDYEVVVFVVVILLIVILILILPLVNRYWRCRQNIWSSDECGGIEQGIE